MGPGGGSARLDVGHDLVRRDGSFFDLLKTEIEDGLAVVQIEFRAGVDPDKKRDEVLREVTALRPTLPAELVRLDVTQFNAAKVNIAEVALVSDAPYRVLAVRESRFNTLPGRRMLEPLPDG